VIDYYSIDDSLQDDGLPYSPAELHGHLVGRFLFGVGAFSFESWLRELQSDMEDSGDLRSAQSGVILAQICAEVMKSLQQKADTLSLMLPDDDVDIRDRLEALAHWINGFMVGLAFGGLRVEDLDKELREAFDDLRAISAVDLEVEAGEDSEQPFAELVEYVRMVVLHLLESDRARELWSGQSDQTRLH